MLREHGLQVTAQRLAVLRAVADAPRKDGGFSALTLGFTLGSWGVAAAARAAGLESRAEELERCRDELLRRVADGRP